MDREYQSDIIAGERRFFALEKRTVPVGFIGRGDDLLAVGVVGQSDAAPILPRGQLQDISLKHLIPGDANQRTTSLCHSYAGANAMMVACAIGGNPVQLSGFGLGMLVTGGQNRGAAIQEVAKTLLTVGCPLAEDVPEFNSDRNAWKSGWEKRLIKATEVWDCGHENVMAACASLLNLGCVPFFGSTGPWGPHAVVQVSLRAQTDEREIHNSWGNQWGTNGCKWFSSTAFRTVDQFGAVGIRVAS